jgi:tRNA G18 (ribose-2'-O)-methylase SpoU
MGGIFRNVAALGGSRAGVILSPRCCDPLYRKAIRVSMGHVLRVAWARVDDWAQGLEAIRGAGFDLIGLSPEGSAGSIEEIGPGRMALVLGSEGAGLSAAAAGRVGRVVRIPMSEGVDSLNVSVACAIALHRLRG